MGAAVGAHAAAPTVDALTAVCIRFGQLQQLQQCLHLVQLRAAAQVRRSRRMVGRGGSCDDWALQKGAGAGGLQCFMQQQPMHIVM